MNLRARMRWIRTDEQGFAIVIAVALMTMVTIISLGLMTLAQGEDSHSRRDLAADSAYQAAEAGTNAFLSDLTEASGTAFPMSYIAKGEATRTDNLSATHPNDCSTLDAKGVPTCNNISYNYTTMGKWTYKTTRASDKGWYTVPGTGYQYLINVYPADPSLSGLASVISRIDVTGRPCSVNVAGTACVGSNDLTRWKTIETQLRPSSLSDFQAFLATSVTYASTATTTGPIFVGEDKNGVAGNLTHNGIAKANLYAEGTVSVGGSTLQNGARAYDKNSNPTALCKLNNCTTVPFSQFSSTFATVSGAASAGGISLPATDPTNSSLSTQGYVPDAWKLTFLSNGHVTYSSCKLYKSGSTTYADYDSLTPPTCTGGTSYSPLVPTNGAIYSPVDVLVSGVVVGRVTVATAGSVVYGGNVTYNTPGADVLGVEATGTVYIAQWAEDANGNITIYSAQFGLNGPFTADPNCNSPTSCHAVCSNGAKCVMTIYGSTAVYGQSGSAISMTGMFNTRSYNYDPNLLFVQPPYWPTLGNAFTILTQRPI